jgi:hypothetical protein
MVWMFGIAVFSRIGVIGTLWVTRMGTQSVLDRCEGRDVRKGCGGVCWGCGEDGLGRSEVRGGCLSWVSPGSAMDQSCSRIVNRDFLEIWGVWVVYITQ